MVSFIVGEKGKGKTKILLDKVNAEVRNASGNIVYLDKSTKHMFEIKEASGNIVYLDKNTKHMYELNNKIRLVDVSEYDFSNCDEFYGFICGIISQDHDLEQMYLDSFLTIAVLEGQDITPTLKRLQEMSEKFDVDFYISVSINASELPAEFSEQVIAAL